MPKTIPIAPPPRRNGSRAVRNSIGTPSTLPTTTNFYKLKRNPFKNVIAETTAHIQATDNLRFTVEPYLWYGYGNGGNGSSPISEAAPNKTTNYNGYSVFSTGAKPIDLNGNGNTRDTILYYEPSITETYRPGVQTQADYQLANHNLSAGLWYEHARHAQTAPFSPLDGAGNPLNIWGDTNKLLDPATGAPLEYRNWVTINEAKQLFVQTTPAGSRTS